MLGPLRPLLGEWTAKGEHPQGGAPIRCSRTFRPFGDRWIELDARWRMGPDREYREIALFGVAADGKLGFFSFTIDGKRSEGCLADASDIHPKAIAFEARMPAGLARSVYWPLDGETGFNFAVESLSKQGWKRFLRHEYRPLKARR